MTQPEAMELRRRRYRGVITPSKINPWRFARDEGDKFTGRQLYWMEQWGIDPATADVIEVRSTATLQEWTYRPGHPMPVYILECPVLGPVRADGRVQVLSPAGHKKLVYTDGAITRRKPWRPRA